MGHAAAESAPVAHLGVTNERCGATQQGGVLLRNRRSRHVAIGGHGVDDQLDPAVCRFGADVSKPEPGQIEEHSRCGEAQPHERQQRLSAGDDFRLIAVFGKCTDCFLDRSDSNVSKRCGNHGNTASAEADVEVDPCSAAHRMDSTIIW